MLARCSTVPFQAGSARNVAAAGQRSLRAPRRAGRLAVRAEGSWSENLINAVTVAINKSPLAEGKKALAVAQAGNYDAAATKALVDQLVSSNKVVVFSWTRCPFCVKAKALLEEVGAQYTAVELDARDDGQAIRAELAKATGRTSVPNVYISGTSYGGCNDGPGIVTLHKEGKLKPLLQAAGAL